MAVYSLPWDRQEQIKVCVALRNHSFVSFTEKDELEKIERNIQYHKRASQGVQKTTGSYVMG